MPTRTGRPVGIDGGSSRSAQCCSSPPPPTTPPSPDRCRTGPSTMPWSALRFWRSGRRTTRSMDAANSGRPPSGPAWTSGVTRWPGSCKSWTSVAPAGRRSDSPPSPTLRTSGLRTSSTATSPPPVLMRCGWRTLRIARRGRASSMSPSSSTSSPDDWSAGRQHAR